MKGAIGVSILESVGPRRNSINFDMPWVAAFAVATNEARSDQNVGPRDSGVDSINPLAGMNDLSLKFHRYLV